MQLLRNLPIASAASRASRARKTLIALPPVLVLACVAGGAAHAERAGFQPGEAFTYKFSVGIVEAGRARMSVGYPVGKGSSRLVAVQGDAHSSSWLAIIARLDDTYKVVLDADRHLPSRVTMVETGIRNRTINSEVDGNTLKQSLVAPGRDLKLARVVPSAPRDPVGALFILRAHPLADGDRVELLALDGVALYRAVAVVTGREEISWGEGAAARKVRAIRLDCIATRVDDSGNPVGQKDRRLRLYLSDDDLRIPYRISGDTDLGEARLDLTSYVPGRAQPAATESAAVGATKTMRTRRTLRAD